MEELTKDQVAEMRQALEALKAELEELLSTTRDASRPVDVDEPIGRLTRVDAIQQQSMSVASRRGYDLRLRQVCQALRLVQRGDYGLCRRCKEPIGHARLAARPESPYCLDCQDDIDRRNP